MHTRAKRMIVAKATALGATVPQGELFVLCVCRENKSSALSYFMIK